MPIVQILSTSAGGAPGRALAASAPLADLPVSLIWAVAVLAFGVLLMVCVLLLLKRESEPLSAWDVGGAARGRHLQHLSRLLRAIRAINSLVVAERDGLKLLEKACLSLTATRGYRMAWIGLLEDGAKRVKPVTQAGFENGYLEEIEITWDDSPTGQGPTGRAIKSGEPYVMRDIQTAPEYEPWREQALERGYRSSAAVPLRFKGQVLGALNVYSDMPDAFDIEEVGLLQEVVDHLAYALASIRLEEELAEARSQVGRARRVQSAFEHAPVGMIITDGDGTITGINRCITEFLGGSKTPEEIVGGTLVSELSIFSGPAAHSRIEELVAGGGPVEFECWASGPDGRLRTLHCRGLPLVEGGAGQKEALWLIEGVCDQAAQGQDAGSAP